MEEQVLTNFDTHEKTRKTHQYMVFYRWSVFFYRQEGIYQ